MADITVNMEWKIIHIHDTIQILLDTSETTSNEYAFKLLC